MTKVAPLPAAMEMFRRRISNALPIQYVAPLLAVVSCPGITMPELVETLDLPRGTVSGTGCGGSDAGKAFVNSNGIMGGRYA